MIDRVLPKAAVLGLALVATVGRAESPVPEESGWSGFINLGIGAGSSETNMVDGIFSLDLGSDKISSLADSPDDEDIVMPAIRFELAYTLGDSLTQFYISNQGLEYVRFDQDTTLGTHAGVRQHIDTIGTIDLSLGASLPTDIWKDPYVVDTRRGDTERTSSNVRIRWRGILGTSLEFDWTYKDIEIDDERSGEALELTAADQRLLRRTGTLDRFALSYGWQINKHHQLVPAISWLDFDLDGDAMKEDGPGLQLGYIYSRDRWRLDSKVFYQDLESDARNPIFDDERSMETWGAAATVFYAQPFGLTGWTANASVAFHDSDSNIDFYDSSLVLVSIGMLYRFD